MATANPFQGIEHIVVLMLENRSFDNVLGRTFEPDAKRLNNYYPSWEHRFPIPIPGFTIPGRNVLVSSIPTPDPGEWWQYMNQQIFGLLEPPPVNAGSPTQFGPLGPMGGFVQNYHQTLEAFDYPTVLTPTIMHGYTADQMPVTTALGKAFAVVDTHFASAPCQTMPNRCFAQLGTALGFVNNDSYLTGNYNTHTSNAPYFAQTIFNQVGDTPGLDWKVYFNDFPLTALMANTWPHLDRFHCFDKFKVDVAADQLPSYSWIEPAYQLFASDNHPPHDINIGEFLLAEVYNTLRANAALFEKTLLIVTYDEHGGCYDPVFPPTCTPDDQWADRTPQFAFDRYGVRVPTLLISPRIAPGTLGTPGTPGTPGGAADPAPVYDHTSILATARRCLGLQGGPLSRREADANDYGAFLTLDPSSPNLGPPEVSVGLSREDLELQAVANTLSSLGQLWYENHHKIPTSADGIAQAHAAHATGTWAPPPADASLSDAGKLEDIHQGLLRLFGRRPVGLMRWTP
ncbi:MAG: phosphoesterase [Burkholderiales bacterium]|nr:phosphoesterase [Burkholderiales bacterium]